MIVERYTAAQWEKLSEIAHLAMFGTSKPKEQDRFHYVWVGQLNGRIGGYVTVTELDDKSVNWDWGGSFPWCRGSMLTARYYGEMVRRQMEVSETILTKIDSANVSMLRLAMANGFRICGCRTWGGETLVELRRDHGDTEKLRQHAESKADGQEAVETQAPDELLG